MILRYIKKYYGRSIVIFLSFLFAIIIICTNGIMKQSANRQNIEFLKNDSEGKLISVFDIEKDALEYLKSEKSIKNLKVENLEDSSALDSKYRINIISNSNNDRLVLESGRMPENKDEVAAQQWVLENMGKKTGDTIEYTSYFDKTVKKKKITGVFKNVSKDKDKGRTEFITYFRPEQLNKMNTVSFDMENDKNIEKNYHAVLGNLEKRFKIDNKKIVQNKMLYDAYREDGNTLKETFMLMIMSILFSSIIVFSTYFISVRDRIKDIGILRAMGIGRTDAFRLIAGELAALAAPAMIAGILISMGIASVLNRNGLNGYYEAAQSDTVDKLGIPYNVFITLAVMILAAILIISSVMYIFSMKNNPIDSINVENQMKVGKSFRFLRKRTSRRYFEKMNIGRLLSFRYFKKDGIIMILIVLSMSIAVSEIIVQGYNVAVSHKIIEEEKFIKDGDVFVQKANIGNDEIKLEEKKVEELSKIDGVEKSAWSGAKFASFDIPENRMNSKAYFDEQNKSPYSKEVLKGLYRDNGDSYTIKTVLNGYDEGGLKMLDDYSISGKIDWKKLKDENTCVLYYPKYYISLKNKSDARNNLIKYKVGDEITVDVPVSLKDKPGQEMLLAKYWSGEYKPETVKKKLKVVGIVDYLPVNAEFGPINSVCFVMDYNNLKKLDMDNSLGYSNATIFTKEGRAEDVYNAMINKIGADKGFTVTNMNSEKNFAEDGVENYINLESAKYIAFILICIMCILNILNYKVINKKKDLSMFRALGMTDGDMKNMIISEGLIYAGSATVMSLIITVIREYMIIKDFEVNYHITGISIDINIIMYLAVFLIYLLICVLGVYIPSRKLLKENITEGIKSIN